MCGKRTKCTICVKTAIFSRKFLVANLKMTECVICLEEGNLIRPCSKCTVETHEHCWCLARSVSNQCPVCRADLQVIHAPGVETTPDQSRVSRRIGHHPVLVNLVCIGAALGLVAGVGFIFAEF